MGEGVKIYLGPAFINFSRGPQLGVASPLLGFCHGLGFRERDSFFVCILIGFMGHLFHNGRFLETTWQA